MDINKSSYLWNFIFGNDIRSWLLVRTVLGKGLTVSGSPTINVSLTWSKTKTVYTSIIIKHAVCYECGPALLRNQPNTVTHK